MNTETITPTTRNTAIEIPVGADHLYSMVYIQWERNETTGKIKLLSVKNGREEIREALSEKALGIILNEIER